MMNDKYYNAEIKERYFDTIENQATREITEYTFKKAKETEDAYEKDIYEMNKDQLGEVIKGLSASTLNSAYNYVFKLQYYMEWATKNGYRMTNLTPFDEIDDKKEWVKPFVAEYKQSLFTRQEILDMCGQLANDQDRAVLLGLFEGIVGEGYSELLNLRRKDIKEVSEGVYKATLHDKWGEIRTIDITEELAECLFKADVQPKYYNKNGESDSVKSSESILVESPYIFKKSARGKQEGKLDLFFVNRKFQMFKTLFGTKFLTTKEVVNSGILHMANELHQENGSLSEEDWEKIAIQYNTSFIKYKDQSHRNIFALKDKAKDKKFEEKYGYKLIEED